MENFKKIIYPSKLFLLFSLTEMHTMSQSTMSQTKKISWNKEIHKI